jgi:DNA-directed RNA polymerase beta' subunit
MGNHRAVTFDGDEMNIHAPQSVESVAELQELSAAKHNIISAQGSKPIICIVQDSLTGAYLMTKENKSITRTQFFDISMVAKVNGKEVYSPEKIQKIIQVLKLKGKEPNVFNGKGLISLILPDDFIYEKKNDANPEEPIVKIYRGVLYEGTLDKTILGVYHNSLIQVINKEYGIELASDFISNMQFITNKWLLVNGFSIGLEDCLVNDVDSVNKIQDKISKCYMEAEGIAETTRNPNIREYRITAALGKAKDIGMKIAKDAMSPTNNFLSTVYSGSKGDFFNIAQLTGLLGQQNLFGKRVQPTLSNGKRTLPHYPFDKMDNEDEYESRGFVRHSFIEGLNPQEFFFHAMSGREGICDTAMGKLLAQVMLKALLVFIK